MTPCDPPELDRDKPESLLEGRFAVILLDNQMPVLSGLDAVGRLRDMERHDFVVGVTGNDQLSDMEEYMTAVADRVLTKPNNELLLMEILAIADERRRRSRSSGRRT